MQVKIDYTKTAQQNANDYYQKAKKLLQKKQGAQKAIRELEQKLKRLEQQQAEQQQKPKVSKIVHKQWYQKFHWFMLDNQKPVIAGRDAHQNELLNSKQFADNDLFFHANIFGAAVTIMKDGSGSTKQQREEGAQFAACYSSAWKESLKTIDVYAMRREQVSKSTGKGSLGTGSFLLSGEREWFRSTPLALVMMVIDGILVTIPSVALERVLKSNPAVTTYIKITQGKESKSDAAKRISHVLNYANLDDIIRELPAGSFKLEAIKLQNSS